MDSLGQDLVSRKVSVACLQETHRPDGETWTTQTGGKILCIPEPNEIAVSQRYGLGFYVAKELWDNCMGYRRVSNRVAVLTLGYASKENTRQTTYNKQQPWTRVTRSTQQTLPTPSQRRHHQRISPPDSRRDEGCTGIDDHRLWANNRRSTTSCM